MLNIVYAEDDRYCRELYAFVLRQQGHRLYEAINGAQAVQLVRDEPIDLVILDIRMPLMNGYEAARRIATESPSVPVAFLSARNQHTEITHAFTCSTVVVDYLVKPIWPQKLVAWVDNILEGCRNLGLETLRKQNMARELVLDW